MAKSKDQLLAKIDNLILEINSQYTELKNNGQFEGVEVALLASNIDYLSSQVKALHYFQEPNHVPAENVKKEELFTPAINLKYEADEQEVFEEIQEKSSWKEETVINNVHVDNQTVASVAAAVEVPTIEKSTEENPAPIPVVEEPAFIENPVITPVVEERIVEPTATTTVVVNEVVEEAKTVIVEETIITSSTKVETVEEIPSRPLTINELIQQQKQAGINMTQQFQTSTNQDKILDLKAAISLNDKLLFIKDLFNGYSLAYSEALELLNRYDNFAEADAFLQTNYALKNSWAEKPQTVEKFYLLLRKKYN